MKKKKMHSKKTVVLLSFFLFLLLVVVVFSLDNYLYVIQRKERLSKLDNYDNFTMTAHFENRCQDREIMEVDEKKIVFSCIDQIYIHYGSVSLFLEDALNNEYITIDSLLSHTIKRSNKEKEDTDLYYYQNMRENISFEILIDEVSVVFRPVQSS